jgi:hypothetical protein
MNETLRPSTLGEILDRTAHLYRRNFLLFVGTAALPLVLIFALAIPFIAVFAIRGSKPWGHSPAIIAAIVLVCLLALLIYLAAYVFSYAGITQAAVSVYQGAKPTFSATLAGVKPRFRTYLWFMLLQGILGAIIPSLAALALIAPLVYFMSRPGMDFSARFALGFLLALLAVAAIGAMVWLSLSFAMGMAACVAEKKTGWESLLRSWRLSPGARGRIFVTYLLVVAMAVGVGMALAIPLLILVALLPSLGMSSANSSAVFVVMEIVRLAVDFVSQVVLTPVLIIASVLFYYDQRIRREGYDIEWMMRRAGLSQPPSGTPQDGDGGIFPPLTPPATLG